MVLESMNNIKTDSYYKNKILEDINKIIEYTDGLSYQVFACDEKVVDAVLFRLIQISENVKKLSDLFKRSYPQINWSEIVGFRNKIVHDYGKVDYMIVYEVLSQDIPKVKEQLDK